MNEHGTLSMTDKPIKWKCSFCRLEVDRVIIYDWFQLKYFDCCSHCKTIDSEVEVRYAKIEGLLLS